MNQKKWKYHSENIGGNFHYAVNWVNEYHPGWDIVTMEYASGVDKTVVVWREPLEGLTVTDVSKSEK